MLLGAECILRDGSGQNTVFQQPTKDIRANIVHAKRLCGLVLHQSNPRTTEEEDKNSCEESTDESRWYEGHLERGIL